jgi:hypothetical protein
MAKREGGGRRTKATVSTATTASNPTATTDAMEQRVVAFAEQLGRIAGAVQAKTEGWMDRDALNEQIAAVRDSASDLLEQLKTTVSNMASGEKVQSKKTTAAASAKSRGRSGGAVDAPGKKHRKPMPQDSRAIAADARMSTMQAGKPMMKTMKRRGRG